MRRSARTGGTAAIAAAVLAVAGCKVDVDGAPCTTPGSAADCPSGQACGNDLRCSARGASCAGRCDVGASHCDGPGAVVSCTNDDPVCGAWRRQDCGPGVVCDGDDGVVGCKCVGYAGTEFAADPSGSAAGAFPFPTGAASPVQCRFGRLRDALQAAARVAGAASVQAYGSGEVVFGDAETGEQLPLVVPANVTLRSAGAPATATVVRATAPTAASVLAVAGQVNGIRVESVAAAGAGLALSCGASGRPALAGVVVDGGGSLTAGVDVAGACGAALTGVEVSNVAGPALHVAAGAGAPVDLVAGRYRASAQGIAATGGKLTAGADGDAASAVEVSDNAGEGVLLDGKSAAIEAALFGAIVRGNGGTGIVLDNVPAGSRFIVRGCAVSSNGTGSPRVYGPASRRQPVGGVLIRQTSLAAFAFAGNRVFANTGDQLAFETDAPWSISTSGCGPASNAFGCVATGAYALGVAGAGNVDARYSVWPGILWDDYVSKSNVTVLPYCNGDPSAPPPPACPGP